MQDAPGQNGPGDGGIEGGGPIKGLGPQGGDHRIARVETGGDQGRRKAGPAGTGRDGLDHRGGDTERRQGPDQGRPGDTRPDHGNRRQGRIGVRPGRQDRFQPFALAAVPRAFGDGEPPVGQTATDRSGDGEGGQTGPGGRPGRNRVEDPGRPHVGIGRGGEAVEEPGVGTPLPGLQRPADLTHGQIQCGVAGG